MIAGGAYQGLGGIMDISHNGERVWKDGMPYFFSASVTYRKGLIRNLRYGVTIEESRIINQGGGYACSTPEIDGLVDLACSCPGVLGAQIASSLQNVNVLFNQVQLDESRTCVSWAKDVDLPSDIIYEYGKQLV